MIKYKTTDREQREGNTFVLGFSYCSIQNIERHLQPNAYTCGVYGWRADFYNLDGFTISTGYSPLNWINKTDYKSINAYRNKKAVVLRSELLKLEKKLSNNFYSWQKTGSYEKAQKGFKKVFNNIVKKACLLAEQEANKFRD